MRNKLCNQIQIYKIESIHVRQLDAQIKDLQGDVHRIKMTAEEEVARAQQQLKQARGMLENTTADLSARIDCLKCELRVCWCPLLISKCPLGC